MLSLLSYDKFSGQVEGMNQIQKQYEEKIWAWRLYSTSTHDVLEF